MRFNSKKCHISRQRNKCSPVYNLRTDLLSTANSHNYLGITVSSDLKGHEHISNICYKATRTLNFVRRNTYCCSHEAKNLAYVLSSSPLGVRRCSEGSAYCQPATWTSSTSCCPFCQERLSPYNFCHWSARRTWLVAGSCSNVVNTLVWRFSTRRWITFRPFLWIISQFHHGILEPPTKINLCHCQFVLMSSFFHRTITDWNSLPLAVRLSQSTQSFHGALGTRHFPTVADHHDTPAVTGGLHPLLDISPKNRRSKNRS